MLYAPCFTGESPLFEWVRTKYIKSAHFSPSNFKHSLHTSKASINSFSVRCQQSIILSTIKTKMPVSAPRTKNKPRRGRAQPGGLLLLLWYPWQWLPTDPACGLRILLNTVSSLPTAEEVFAIKCICSLCTNSSDDKSRRMRVTQGLSCNGGCQDHLWQVLDTEKRGQST